MGMIILLRSFPLRCASELDPDIAVVVTMSWWPLIAQQGIASRITPGPVVTAPEPRARRVSSGQDDQ
jgi:hypothetical protein